MKFGKWLVCLMGLLPFLGADAGAQEAQNILRDYESDVSGNAANAVRVRLKSQPGVKMGRIAGVWGSIGGGDTGDSFFLGKTPDSARMQFSLSALGETGTITLVVTEEDGSNSESHTLSAAAGETAQGWYALKGKIIAQVSSSGGAASNYALYFWYPGDVIDALNSEEFTEIKDAKDTKRPTLIKAVRGAGNE